MKSFACVHISREEVCVICRHISLHTVLFIPDTFTATKQQMHVTKELSISMKHLSLTVISLLPQVR